IAEDPHWSAVALAAGETGTLAYDVQPARRGDRPFGRAIAFESGPFGLMRRRTLGPGGDAPRVSPASARAVRGDALHPRRLALAGVRSVRRRGEGMEFESLRD